MGYTHYWRTNYDAAPPDAFGRTLLDAKRLIDNAQCPIADGMGQGGPVFEEAELVFNGRSPDDYEGFHFTGAKPSPDDPGWISMGEPLSPWHFAFCKTAHRPYDAVVCAVLLRAAQHYGPAIRVSSDGWWTEWDAGRELVRLTFGEDPECPFPDDQKNAERAFG